MPIKLALQSPLRYPGSKASLVKYIENLIEENSLQGCHLLEPYAGSAIVSLELLKKRIISKATIVEVDPLIYAFWKSVFFYTDELIEKLEALPVTIDTWNNFQKFRNTKMINQFPVVDMGLAGLFFNRTNFSGILKAGPIGGINQKSIYKIDCRFNKDRLANQIAEISLLKKDMSVIHGDALHFLKGQYDYTRKNQCFLYIDPPYYAKGKSLYRYWYNQTDHQKLAHFLMPCDIPWLASYDNHEEIRKIYNNARALEEMYFDYQVSNRRKEKELLISNLEIPPGMRSIYL